MQVLGRMLVVMVALVCMQTPYADAGLIRRQEVRAFIQDLAAHDHFQPRQLRGILAAARYQPQVISAMERPFEKKNWDVYQALFLTPERINAGLDFWKHNQSVLQQAAKQYGLPPEMIVAILGVETLYGKHQGEYRVLDALSTLAFYYPARAPYFKRELREFLLLCREQQVAPTLYKGSYAGAIGKPQFMPSSYRSYAINFLGQGRANLMEKDQDAIVSVANYFKKNGWQSNQLVAEPVHVPQQGLSELVLNSKTPNYTIAQLLQLGVEPSQPTSAHPHKAGVLEMITDNGSEYWMAYPNFYVIKRYNTSPQYALVVYLLAKSLRERHAALTA